ncbi:tryptophan halogenase family protein [Pseudoalteromonas sp. MMG012]|uniref:tryptophan halogenase family protein n=1 Tax=Pseudoalteromonas sp. MMG012 TaxID=2822686 RepID=UPI001B3A57B7|nr:tryptophan halogenase family protein [Pseudoalteromonas sp. MMG012]MBQ4849739.1 tryptophan 7-halogenase [Pseudoalteromonas sp. MMG012]
MESQTRQTLTIVGGGTAGWLTASLFAKVMGKQLNIILIESDNIASVGVGEATIPPILPFNGALGIDENTFIQATKATIKLGIQFEGWSKTKPSYMHAFGNIGKDFPFCDFYHHWLAAKALGNKHDFWDFSLNYQAAKQHKFAKLQNIPNTRLKGLSYAYHFDAHLYAQFLSQHAQSMGVTRIEGTVDSVGIATETGFVEQLTLTDGQQVSGDIFVDCTGMQALLIEKTLNCGFEDWSHWLPCDRAMAVQSTHDSEKIEPFTRSTVHRAGWQWRIPLQHRVGNGIVYSSKHMSDESAKATLLENVSGEVLGSPKVIRFRTGKRLTPWHKNVVAIGLSSGFLEPLESTSIHLIQTAAVRLLKLFPQGNINQSSVEQFNRETGQELEQIRDFIILHYKLNDRADSDFWRLCSGMAIPERLKHRIALFKESGVLPHQADALFAEMAWQQVMIGQGLIPEQQHPLIDSLSAQQRNELLVNLKTLIDATVASLPTHDAFLASLQKE